MHFGLQGLQIIPDFFMVRSPLDPVTKFGEMYLNMHKRDVKMPKNGKWKEYSRHAVLVAEGNYCDDLKHGLWKQYYETGELIIEEMYHLGVMHGRYAAYYLNGQVLAEGEYINGSREGYFHVYDETGNLIKTLLFVNNVEVESEEKTGLHASH